MRQADTPVEVKEVVSPYRVVVIEDDPTLLQSLTAIFESQKVEVFGTSRAEEARDHIQHNRVSLLLVDCLLPSESGVDFAKSLRAQFPREVLDIVLMSGIFTDPQFVKESLRDAEALGFLKKPFELSDVMKWIKRPADKKDPGTHPKRQLYQLLSKSKVSSRDQRKAIEALDEIHGFDLPTIFATLVNSGLSGNLNVVTATGDVSGITFNSGYIVGVDTPDRETMIGRLLIEAGYILPDDLEKVVNVKSAKRIGERLISENYLSPHGFEIVLGSQMSIRLSKTIVDQPVKVNFVESEIHDKKPRIESPQFQLFLHDWIASKLSSEWLKAHYTQLTNSRIIEVEDSFSKSAIWESPLLKTAPDLKQTLKSSSHVGQLLDQKKYDEILLYRCLHLLNIQRVIRFEEDTQKLSDEDRLKLFKRLQQQFLNKTLFETFDLVSRMTAVPDSEVAVVVQEFQKILGPKPSAENSELGRLWGQLHKLAEDLENFVKGNDREKMRAAALQLAQEERSRDLANFEAAKNFLQMSQYKEAWALVKKLKEKSFSGEKFILYFLWAKLCLGELQVQKTLFLKEVDVDLVQVVPEDKFDPLYFFILGLVGKVRGDLKAAKKSFEKALSMDSNLIVARRELSIILSMVPEKQDLLTGDLRTLVGGLFKKKSS